MIDPVVVRREFQKIRAARHAIDVEEFSVGLRCVAAPVFNRSHKVVASLGIAGPSVRLSSDRLPRLVSLVRESAGAASRALGGEAPA